MKWKGYGKLKYLVSFHGDQVLISQLVRGLVKPFIVNLIIPEDFNNHVTNFQDVYALKSKEIRFLF